MRSGPVAADLFYLVRRQPGNDRGPRSRVQGVELVVNVLHDSLCFLVLLAQLESREGQERGGTGQQRRLYDPRR